jgi:hypothetical protein
MRREGDGTLLERVMHIFKGSVDASAFNARDYDGEWADEHAERRERLR